MHLRRLVKAGQTSHTVSLPISWINRNKLKKGDTVFIEENENNLVVKPRYEEVSEDKEITIGLDEMDLETLQREITAAYINNYKTINIMGKSIEKYSREVRSILHDFVALEIAEQTSNKIVAKDLLNMKEISVDKTIRRMDIIIRSIMEDCLLSFENENKYGSISQRDLDVNRLYFLMFRISRGALSNAKLASSFNLSNVEASNVWYLAMNLESIADNIKNTCKLLIELRKDNIKGLKSVLEELQNSYLEVMKAHYNKDKKLAHDVSSKRDKILESLENKKINKPEILNIVGNLKEFGTLISNVARIVIDNA